jgi:hypothetical protein
MLKSEEFDEKKFLEAEIERLYASIEAERRIIKKEIDYRNTLIDLYFNQIIELKKELEEMEK